MYKRIESHWKRCIILKEIAPTKKSETEGIVSPTKAGEKEKVAAPALSSPSRVQSPGAETSLDFVKYTCDTRKTAVKDGNIITISSVTQSRVRIEGFTSGRNMLGNALGWLGSVSTQQLHVAF